MSISQLIKIIISDTAGVFPAISQIIIIWYLHVLASLCFCLFIITQKLKLGAVCIPWSVPPAASGSADRSNSLPVTWSSGGCDHCTYRWWESLNFLSARSSPTVSRGGQYQENNACIHLLSFPVHSEVAVAVAGCSQPQRKYADLSCNFL